MGDGALKRKVITGLAWKALESASGQGVQFAVQVVLARLLLPDDYGTLVLALFGVAIADALIQTGVGRALVQKGDVDDIDLSSMLCVGVALAAVMYAALFFAATGIAAFFGQPLIVPVLRVLGMRLFLGAVNSVQNAVVSLKMAFRWTFLSSLIAAVTSGVVGIAMAYAGLGVWALVAQRLASCLCVAVVLCLGAGWRFRFAFSLARVKPMLGYSWKLQVSSLLDSAYSNLLSLFIGRFYDPATVGYYNRGDSFPRLAVRA